MRSLQKKGGDCKDRGRPEDGCGTLERRMPEGAGAHCPAAARPRGAWAAPEAGLQPERVSAESGRRISLSPPFYTSTFSILTEDRESSARFYAGLGARVWRLITQ